MKQALIIFGEDFGRHPSSTQHLALELASRYEVFYINSVGLRAPKLGLKDVKRVLSKVTAQRYAPTPAPFNVLNLPAISWPSSRLAFKLNSYLWRKKLAFLKERKPLLWISLPTAFAVVGQLNERGVYYYCGDDFGGLAGVDHAPVLKLEHKLAKSATHIFTASDVLKEKFPQEKTTLIAHGVDHTLFATPCERATDLPKGKPIAGFYGSISDWVDIPLMAQTAQTMPDWNFVFVGKINTDISLLQGLKNVFFLGEKPHHALPSYCQHWQVSLLPFLDNEQIRACNPLKLREYLASGTPIVSTFFPALQPYQNLIFVGQNFKELIEKAAQDTARNNARSQSVEKESWVERASQISKIMELKR